MKSLTQMTWHVLVSVICFSLATGSMAQNSPLDEDLSIPVIRICEPLYGDVCVHGTRALSAEITSDSSVFHGQVDTLWYEYFDGGTWRPVIDPVSGTNYDSNPASVILRFECRESEVPELATRYFVRQ